MANCLSLLKLTQSLEELHDGDGHGVAAVVDGVVAELCDPALTHAVLGAGVHEPVVDVHAHDGRAVGVNHLRGIFEKNGPLNKGKRGET